MSIRGFTIDEAVDELRDLLGHEEATEMNVWLACQKLEQTQPAAFEVLDAFFLAHAPEESIAKLAALLGPTGFSDNDMQIPGFRV